MQPRPLDLADRVLAEAELAHAARTKDKDGPRRADVLCNHQT